MSAREIREAFIASSRTVPYNHLIKSADSYAGTKDGGVGIMLLSVTNLGYGVWTDEIWVNYEGHIAGAEGDTITVYGVVAGARSYETQIGGERFVPEVTSRYLVE